MKTAISLPDALFRQAERLAKRLKKSRSEIYREAIAAYVARHDDDAVRRSYDALASALSTDDYAFARRAAATALRKVEW